MEVSGGAGLPEKPRRRLLWSAVLCPRSGPPQPDHLACSSDLAQTAFSDLENQISQRLNEAQCLGLCGQPWEKKGDSQLELENWAGFLAGEIGSELEERDREPTGRFAIPASLSYRVSDFC